MHSKNIFKGKSFRENLLNPISPLWEKCQFVLKVQKCHELKFSTLGLLRLPKSYKPKTTEIFKLKPMKTRWNPKFGLSNLENDFLTSTTLKGAQWFFFENSCFSNQCIKLRKMSWNFKLQIFCYFLVLLWHMPYPCSHFYFDIKFGDRLYSKEKRRAWPVLFWIKYVAKFDIKVKVTTWIGHM